ncbi:MAG: hypothetical protein M3326_01735 [Actinomycetota bacterium]|nr:hypothetical protein [Actinomycetota bacterium]
MLLPPSALDATGRPLRNVATERRIAASAEVLRRAGEALNPPVPASRLVTRVTVNAIGSDILDIGAQAPSPREAVKLADAVAKEYVNFSETATAEQADTSIALLKDTATALQNQIETLTADIAAGSARLAGLPQGSPQAAQQAALLDSQRAAQVDANRQLSALNTRVADARLNAELSRRGLRVLEPAGTPDEPWRRQAVITVGVGGAGGLLVGAMLAIYLGQGDRRLRSRDDVARAAGVPVLASLAVHPPKRVEHWRKLLQRWTPSASERLVLRQAITRLGEPHKEIPSDVAVVTLPGDMAALALAVQLAGFSADFGIPTSLVLILPDRSGARLRSACVVASKHGAEARPHLWVVDGTNGTDTTDTRGADLTITVTALDGDTLSIPNRGLRTTTVLAVSSGFATSDALAAAVLACEDGEQRVAGLLLANPEPDDYTTGTLGLAVGASAGLPPTADAPRRFPPPVNP